MPSPYHHDHPSVIVNGVCSSVYASVHDLLYCDRGEEGPHHYHEAHPPTSKYPLMWVDGNPDALNDYPVIKRLPK